MNSHFFSFIIGAIIGGVVLYIFFWPSIEEREVMTYRTEESIEWVKKDTTIYHYKDSLIFKEIITKREVSVEPDKYDSIRTYQGSDPHLYGRINWVIETGGYLQHLEISPMLTIPIQTVTNTIEKKNTVVLRPKGIYGVGGINNNFNYSIGVTYLNNNSLIGYEYHPQLDLHAVKIGWKIF